MKRRLASFMLATLMAAIVLATAAPSPAASQTTYTVTITSIDTSAFPQISATIAVSSPNGLRVPGLSKNAFTLLENNAPIALSQISEEEIGLQIGIVVESSDVFARRDINLNTRLDYTKTAIINFAVGEGQSGNPYMQDVVDSLTILAPEGPIVEHSSVGGEIRNALISYESEFRFETGLINLITQAMDAATATPARAGMRREVVVFTSGIDSTADAEVSALAARANAEGITIHTILVGSAVSPALPLAENVKALADLTGGSYRYLDSPKIVNSLWDILVSQRIQYRLVYRSGVKQSGQHTLQALANIGGTSILSSAKDFALNIQPPIVSLVNLPSEIVRATDKRGADPASIEPRQQTLAVKIEFPDGYPRNIAKLQLIVDNTIADETTSGPFDAVHWDLTGYSETGTHGVQVFVADELGLEARSDLANVQVTVNAPPPITTIAAPFAVSAAGIGIVVLAVTALAAAIFVIVRRPTVITNIVREATERVKEATEPFIPTPHRGAAKNKQGKAYLERIDDTVPGPHPNIEVIGDNLRLGRDETLVQVTINDRSVSRLHARITEEADGLFFIHDEGSTSGTWVNYKQVSLSGQPLRHADVINLGRVQFRFNLRRNEQPPVVPVVAAPKPTEAAKQDEDGTEPFTPVAAQPKPANETTDQGLKPTNPTRQPIHDQYHTEAFLPDFDDGDSKAPKNGAQKDKRTARTKE